MPKLAAGPTRYPRHGNFVEGAEFFDSGYFGISPPEAAAELDGFLMHSEECGSGELYPLGLSGDFMGNKYRDLDRDRLSISQLSINRVAPRSASGCFPLIGNLFLIADSLLR